MQPLLNYTDIALGTFLSWPVSIRALYLNLIYPDMLPTLRATLLRKDLGHRDHEVA